MNSNNTVVVKTRTGFKEYLYNKMLLKLYKEAPTPKTSEVPKPEKTLNEKRRNNKKKIPEKNI